MTVKKGIGQKLTASPYLLWMGVFVIIPLIMVGFFAFVTDSGEFTLEYLREACQYGSIFWRSVWMAALSTLICLVISYPLAYILSRMNTKVQSTMLMIVMLPMWMNFLLRTYAWMTLLGNEGVINSLLGLVGIGPLKMLNTQGAIVLGMVYNYLPYMILPLYSIMAKLDHGLIEAAEDLGANKLSVLSKVILPLSLPGIASGFTMVFVPSVSTFYISKKLGGNTVSLIGDIIEMQFKSSNNYNLGAALSLVLMVLIVICMAVMNRFTSDDDDGGVLI